VILLKDLFRRLRLSRRWIAAQYLLTLPLILLGFVWLLIPEKHAWQVALTFLLAFVIAVSALELQAGAMRSLANDNGKRVKLLWGACSLLFWIALVWLCWAVLDWCDEQIPQCAGYLNSKAPAHWRARLLTYDHIYLWMTYLEWVLRWIVVPAKVIPYAIASAQSGWRVPVRRILQLLWSWRWWLGVAVVALVCVLLPSHFYSAAPHGSALAQGVRVGGKLAASYLLGVGGWLLLLGWAGVLFGQLKPIPQGDALTDLFDLLQASRKWVGMQFGWTLLLVLFVPVMRNLPEVSWKDWIIVPFRLLLLIAWIVLQARMMRSLLVDRGRRVRLIQGILSMLLWTALAPIVALVLYLWHTPIAPWLAGWIATPAILLPFVIVSALCGLILPWRRVLRVVAAWRWWLGVSLAALGVEFVVQISRNVFSTSGWIAVPNIGVASLIVTGIWILLLGWFAVLFNRTSTSVEPIELSRPVIAE
jgi:hypothetical protein